MALLIAQLSDLHVRREVELVCGRVDTGAALQRAIGAVMALSPLPDAVLLTGDLVDAGDDEDAYRHLRRLLSPLTMPWYPIPGNHDGRDALRRVFADRLVVAHDPHFVHYTVDDFPVRLVFLDTLDPGSGAGLLDAARLLWLRERLAETPDRAVMIAMHHPPFETGIAFMDAIACVGADGLEAPIRAHGRVERIVCGHLHRSVTASFAGSVACSAPSTAHQLRLDLRPFDSSPGAFTLEPPGFLLHRWTAGAGFATHAVTIGSYPGPFPFVD